MDDAGPMSRTAPYADGPVRPPRPPSSRAAIGLLLIAVLAVTAYARALLMPVVLAVLLMLVFTPLRRALDRRGVPSGVTAALVVAGLLAMGVVGLSVLATPASELAASAPELLATLEREVDRLVRSVGGLVGTGAGLEALDPQEAREVVVTQGGGAALGLAGLAPAVLAQLAFVLLLLFFLIASGDMVYEKIVHVSPTFRDKRRAMAIARDIETRLARYLSAIALINAGLGVSVALAFWAIGMPNPLLFGAAAFALNFVPYLGAALGVVVSFVVGLVAFEEPALAFVAAGLYLTLTSVEGNVVTPYFVGRALRLNTVVVFLSVALWAYLWSTVGMLVATPLLVVVRTVCEHVPALQPLSAFLSGRGVEAEPDP
jgi:predicted PurR-regulated permease PerM